MRVGDADLSVEGVSTRLARVQDRIKAAGGDQQLITICAVTKGFPVAAVRAALGAGLCDVGENYAQELLAKQSELSSGARWHMIGRLQRNKVRSLAPHVHLWQSVDRLELGEEIARRAPGAAVLVQVQVTGEEQKGGCHPGEVPGLTLRLAEAGLEVRGLMAVGPTDPATDPRPGFEEVAALAGRLGLPEISMGMSRDLEAAVAAGSTMLRLGTALFGGPRPLPAGAEQ